MRNLRDPFIAPSFVKPLLASSLVLSFLATGACDRASRQPVTADLEAAASPAPAAIVPADITLPRGNEWRQVTLPAGTRLTIVLDKTVGSDISRVEDVVVAHLSRPVSVQGDTVLAAGSQVSGVVTSAQRSGKVKGRAHVTVRFNTLEARGPQSDSERYRIQTSAIGRTAPATKKKDALTIGVPAAGGALIGALVGGKKGALIGTTAAGGAGTAVVLSTRGKEVRMQKGAALSLRLAEPLVLKVRA